MNTKPKHAGRDLQAFRSAHDKSYTIPLKIKAGLAELGDSWEYETEFQRRIGVANVDFSRYRDQFEDHVVMVGGKNPKRIWAGTKSFAVSLRELQQ